MHDQPRGGGGNVIAFDAASRDVRQGWRPVEEIIAKRS
jgi:hypothetical protein